jgi:hypothetical protein
METSAAERWLVTVLKADAALTAVVGQRVYNTRVPSNGQFPCVLFQLQAASNDFVALGGVRVWASLVYLVRGIAEQASFEGNLATIADRIDIVTHAASGTNVAGTVWTCIRERPFQLVEVTEGREFRHLGAILRIQASKA